MPRGDRLLNPAPTSHLRYPRSSKSSRARDRHMPAERFDGRRVLYHYLNQSLRVQNDDQELIQDILSRLINTLGIWFPVDSYKLLPIALPHVVRDPTCRPRRRRGSVTDDEWGSPNQDGYIRDDNSLVKGLTRSLDISPASFSPYEKRRLGAGFVAAHVWSRARSGGYSTRNPITNSFWPNLVWLPADLARLTDRADSFAQVFVQATARRIYRQVEMQQQLSQYVEEAWRYLPDVDRIASDTAIESRLPRVSNLNFFDVSPDYIARRVATIRRTTKALESIRSGTPSQDGRVRPRRYREGLCELRWDRVEPLWDHLVQYADAVEATICNNTSDSNR